MKLYHSIMVLSVAIAVWILVQAYGSFVTTSHAYKFQPDLERILYRIEQRLDKLESK